MYVRKQLIEEENLDWGEHLEKNQDETQEIRHNIHSDSEENKIIFNNIVNVVRNFNIKRSIANFLNEYSEFALMASIVIFPYIVGFSISYFLFHFYGGMSISSFVGMQGQLYMGFWSIGAYLFITAGLIWAVLGFSMTPVKERYFI